MTSGAIKLQITPRHNCTLLNDYHLVRHSWLAEIMTISKICCAIIWNSVCFLGVSAPKDLSHRLVDTFHSISIVVSNVLSNLCTAHWTKDRTEWQNQGFSFLKIKVDLLIIFLNGIISFCYFIKICANAGGYL